MIYLDCTICVLRKDKSVKHILGQGFDFVRFRRTLCVWGESLELWNHIKDSCHEVVLTVDKDKIYLDFM